MNNLNRLPRHFVPRNDSVFGFFLSILFLADIFLQGYFRKIGVGILNRGISFGWWPGISSWITIGIYLAFVIWASARYRSGEKRFGLMAMALGGLGNLLPRLWVGGVWDYLYFPVLARLPAGQGFWFNLSDALISFGVISYILVGDGNHDSLRGRRHPGDKQTSGFGGESSSVD